MAPENSMDRCMYQGQSRLRKNTRSITGTYQDMNCSVRGLKLRFLEEEPAALHSALHILVFIVTNIITVYSEYIVNAISLGIVTGREKLISWYKRN